MSTDLISIDLHDRRTCVYTPINQCIDHLIKTNEWKSKPSIKRRKKTYGLKYQRLALNGKSINFRSIMFESKQSFSGTKRLLIWIWFGQNIKTHKSQKVDTDH